MILRDVVHSNDERFVIYLAIIFAHPHFISSAYDSVWCLISLKAPKITLPKQTFNCLLLLSFLIFFHTENFITITIKAFWAMKRATMNFLARHEAEFFSLSAALTDQSVRSELMQPFSAYDSFNFMRYIIWCNARTVK